MNASARGGIFSIPRTFSLEATFTCGQCFRFEQGDDGKWHGVSRSRELRLYEEGEQIVFENVSEADFREIWADYFDLGYDYAGFWEDACENETLRKIVHACAPAPRDALHILRQEPWEALASFLISQNNHIPRIRRIIRTFCETFGERIGEDAFAFPTPAVIASLSCGDLAPLRCGYRADYLIDAARRVESGETNLLGIAALPLAQARSELLKIFGVGPKVAECVLLYGFHRMEAFPIDVWMRRAMARFFPAQDPDCFGPGAGLAQQYIFAYSRLHPELFGESGENRPPRENRRTARCAKT